MHITLLGRFEVAVDGVAVPARSWARRHATALVKVLALAPGRRLHREQVLDLLWPDDPAGKALPKLHKAAHFARRAIDVADAVVLRGDDVLLCPDADTTVDVVQFEELARRALTGTDAAAARRALEIYGGELLPHDRYEPWAQERREHLRLRHLDLLRLDGCWEALLELDPSDEVAHLALMKRHRANGDHLAALRQFERLSSALRRELGLAPGREATALRDRILAERDVQPRRAVALLGRDRELAIADRALVDAATGRSRTLIVSGPAGMGKSALVGAIAARAAARGFRVGSGTSAAVEGAWPYAPVLEALAEVCRRDPGLLDDLAGPYRGEIERALSGAETSWNGDGSHQLLFTAAAELVGMASAATGLLLTVEDVHDADDASLRLLHHLARSAHSRRVCIVVSHGPGPPTDALVRWRRSLLDRYGAVELPLGPLGPADVAALVRRHIPDPPAGLLDQVGALARGIPFAVQELARGAATGSLRSRRLEAGLIGVPAATRAVLQRVAVAGSVFDTDEFVALAGLPENEAFDHLDAALAALVVEPDVTGYRFRHALVREALLGDLPTHRRRQIHRDAAARLIGLQASPARIGHHLREAGAVAEAVPYLLRAAVAQAAVGAYREALALVDTVRPNVAGDERSMALALRGDLLNALGDPRATSAYREALDGAAAGRTRHLRVRLARAAMMTGDLDTAVAALDGLDLDGGDEDVDILLTRGKSAYFAADFPTAQAAADRAEPIVLAGAADWRVLDLVSLQGMLAHRSGGWFDRLRVELHRTRESPEVANTIFDGYLCPAEYLLYGPTPYADVVEVARDLQATARRSGAQRAAAFAAALLGEAALLSGDLELAMTELSEACALHHELGGIGGEAHASQRLAEVHLALGNRDTASGLLRHALPLARRSLLARHLLHRVFGTMITAAADPHEARAIVDQAESSLGWEDLCVFCSVMLFVPATIACARVGDLGDARRLLDLARNAALLWEGTSWEAAILEADAAVAVAGGDLVRARAGLAAAAEGFDRAGQPLDALRCRGAAAELSRHGLPVPAVDA